MHRDLFADGRTLDELDWRELWAYITKAPPLTAIHYDRTEGWAPSDEFLLEQFNELRELNWRYTALHFKKGADQPFPERITRQMLKSKASKPAQSVTLDDLVPAHVRALLQGG